MVIIVAIIFCLLLLVNVLPSKTSGITFAADETIGKTQEEIEQELKNNVDGQLGTLDFSALDRYVQGLLNEQKNVFGSQSFSQKLSKLLNGELSSEYGNVFSAIIGLIFGEVLGFIPLIATILAVAVISSIINSIKSDRNKNLTDLIHFVCYGIIVVIIVKVCADFLQITTGVLSAIKTQMDIILPILLTFMVAMGGVVSAQVYQPVVAILSGVIITLFNTVLIPIFICCFVFAVLSNLTNVVKFEKFQQFFQSLFKWITGTVFMVFMTFMSLQGIIAATHDGVTIRTARYTLKGAVPIIGGALSDGFDLILTSSLLIKNAVGVSAIMLLLATVLMPVIKIIVFGLMLKLTAAIIEPISDSRIPNLAASVGKILPLLVVLILGAVFMFAITLLLVMFTANKFV